MRTYEITVKTPAIYGREGAGTMRVYKVDAASRARAAGNGIRAFSKEVKPLDRVGRTMFLTIVRVN